MLGGALPFGNLARFVPVRALMARPSYFCFKGECRAHCHGARFEPNSMLVFKDQGNCLFPSFPLPSPFLKLSSHYLSRKQCSSDPKTLLQLGFQSFGWKIILDRLSLKFAPSAPGCYLLTARSAETCAV